MDISGKRGQAGDAADMRFVIKYGLIEMGYAPAQRNIAAEEPGQLGRGPSGVCVPPCAERHQDLPVGAESHVAVHHRTHAYGRKGLDVNAVGLRHIRPEIGIAVAYAAPDRFEAVCPQAVCQTVLPTVAALGDHLVVPVYEHRFDAGGAELYAKDGSPRGDAGFRFPVHISKATC